MTDALDPYTQHSAAPVTHRDTDLALLERMSAGDESALAEFITIHSRYAYVVAKRILGDTATTEDIEEILSDVFIRAWSSAHQYDPSKASVATWLSWIVLGHALTRRRSILRFRKLRAALLEHPSAKAESSSVEYVEDALDARTKLDGALAALRVLDPLAAELILRRYVAEDTAATIAKTLGVSPAAVRVRLHRAVRRLRGLLTAAQSPYPKEG